MKRKEKLNRELSDLKAKQALSSSLQEKWADEREWQQNTMFANSGGLANLFRVKN